MNAKVDTTQESVNEALDRVRHEIADISAGKKPVAPSSTLNLQPPGGSTPIADLDKLNAPIEALYQQKRRELVELQIKYHRDNTELATAYHGRLSDLEHEAHEALRALDKKFQADAAPLRAMLDRLTAMRG